MKNVIKREVQTFMVNKNIDVPINVVVNNIFIVISLGFLLAMMIYILYRKELTTKLLGKNLLILGSLYIIGAVLLPRFSGYCPKPDDVEMVFYHGITFVDGELCTKGLLLLLFSHITQKWLIITTK